jgi:uncharacterized protein (DUF2267 family)
MTTPQKTSEVYRKQMIAEAAYFRAERRGFSGGSFLADWLQAESEVDSQLRETEHDPLLDRPKEREITSSATEVPVLDKTLQKANQWLRALQIAMGCQERQTAYVALRAVLHATRDRIPPNEAADLAAQLPMLIRGLFYEGWHPANKPLKYRHRKQFLAQVAKEAPALKEDEIEAAVTAVFGRLASELGPGETDQVRALLPAEIRELWPLQGL